MGSIDYVITADITVDVMSANDHIPDDGSGWKWSVTVHRSNVSVTSDQGTRMPRFQVSWGLRPEIGDRDLLSFGEGTLFLWARDGRIGDLLDHLELERSYESVPVSEAYEFDFTTFKAGRPPSECHGAVYHFVLPPLFVPTELEPGPTTRLVSARRVLPTKPALALTFVYTNDLDMRVRARRVSRKDFENRHINTATPTLVEDNLWKVLRTLAKDPTFWRTIATVLGRGQTGLNV